MPTVNTYKAKPGLYIRAQHDGFITTYQVTNEGINYLRSLGAWGGSYISNDVLNVLRSCGMVYTHGSGPGVIFPEDIATQDSVVATTPTRSPPRATFGRGDDELTPELWALIIGAVIIVVVLVIVAVTQ